MFVSQPLSFKVYCNENSILDSDSDETEAIVLDKHDVVKNTIDL